MARDEDGNPAVMQVEITPSALLSVVAEDGTEVAAFGRFTSVEKGNQNCSGSFPIPVDLT